jgi:hypothetical protein
VVGLHHFGFREGLDEPVNQAVEIGRILEDLSTHVEPPVFDEAAGPAAMTVALGGVGWRGRCGWPWRRRRGAGAAPALRDVTSFAVFALSRGKGVPPAAREVMLKVTELVDADKRRGVRVEARRTRIGLEGETKLCVEYQNAAEARVAHERIDKLVKDVDLVNLVPGPCSGPEKPHDGKEKP